MAFGNVIPIDADVARQLARRRIRFRWLVAGLVTLWLAVLMPTLLLTPLPPIATFVALAVLAVLAEHRFVLFGDETSMSASIIVVVASIFMFADTAPLSGPLLIASIAGLYLPHLRSGALDKVAFNGGGMGLAAWLASIAAIGFHRFEGSPLGTLFAVVATLTIYWSINNLIVAGHQATLCGQPYRESAADLIGSDTEVLLWAAVAAVGAAVAGQRSIMGIAFVSAVVLWRIALLHGNGLRFRRLELTRSNEGAVLVWLGALALMFSSGTPWPADVATAMSVVLILPILDGQRGRLAPAGLPLVALLSVGSGPIVVGFIAVVCVAVISLQHRSADYWTASVALGAVATMVMVHSGWVPSNAVPLLVLATASPALIAMSLHGARTLRSSRTLGFGAAIGIAMPSRFGIAAFVGIVGVAALFDRSPLLALAIATAAIALKCVTIPNGPRSSVRASR